MLRSVSSVSCCASRVFSGGGLEDFCQINLAFQNTNCLVPTSQTNVFVDPAFFMYNALQFQLTTKTKIKCAPDKQPQRYHDWAGHVPLFQIPGTTNIILGTSMHRFRGSQMFCPCKHGKVGRWAALYRDLSLPNADPTQRPKQSSFLAASIPCKAR